MKFLDKIKEKKIKKTASFLKQTVKTALDSEEIHNAEDVAKLMVEHKTRKAWVNKLYGFGISLMCAILAVVVSKFCLPCSEILIEIIPILKMILLA